MPALIVQKNGTIGFKDETKLRCGRTSNAMPRSCTVFSFSCLRLAAPLLCFLLLLTGCSGSESPENLDGAEVYELPQPDGNTFACATCHALSEPAADGLRRPGHPIGDALGRPSFKNGQVDTFLAAANTCLVEWMTVSEPWTDESPRFLALKEFLEERAGEATEAPPLQFEIVPPPADAELMGGSVEVGRDVFNQTCSVCHAEDAVGTERAPALRGETLDAELIARRVRTSGEKASPTYDGLTGGRMPFWSASRMSDAELVDVIAFLLQNDPAVAEPPSGEEQPGERECSSAHAKVGQRAELSMLQHGVAGTATIVDDCTIRIESFDFDGGGIEVRIYGGVDGDYTAGFAMGPNLVRSTPYAEEVLEVQLPLDRTLDDLDGISVWCVAVGSSFGDGLFQ